MNTRPLRHEFFSLGYSLHKLFFQTFSKGFFFLVFRPPQFCLFVCLFFTLRIQPSLLALRRQGYFAEETSPPEKQKFQTDDV